MDKHRLALTLLIIGSLLIASLLMLKPTPSTAPPPAQLHPHVQIQLAQPKTEHIRVHTQGVVRAKTTIELIAEVSGKITQTSQRFANGRHIAQGEPLISLDARDYELAVTTAKAQVVVAKEQLALEQGRSRQAQREWHDLGNAAANALFLRQPQLAAAKAKLTIAQADWKKTKLAQERTTISAPFNGIIQTTQVGLGQYVSQGTPLAHLYASDTVEIHLPLSQQQVKHLSLPDKHSAQDTPATVVIKGAFYGARQQWLGRIVGTGAQMHTDDQMLDVIVEVSATTNQLTGELIPPPPVGLFVEALIPGRDYPNIVTVPRQALQPSQQLLVVDQQQRLQFKAIEVIQIKGDNVLVQGLDNGAQVVTSSLPYAEAGMLVSTTPIAIADSHRHQGKKG